MTQYWIPEFTPEQRAAVTVQMLSPSREWGFVTKMAHRYGVSRPLLYKLRDRLWDTLVEAMQPRPAGRPTQTTRLKVDRDFINRAIVTLSLLKGTVRDLRLGLHLLLGVTRSVGYLSQTLTAAGEQAQAYHLRFPLPILGEADKIFQGRQPCLTVVDGRSFLVVNLTPAESRDATAWGLTFLALQERGIRFHDLACDEERGLRAGVREAELAVPLRPDLFHLWRDAHRLTQRLEKAAYRAIETAERARRAEQKAQGLIRRRGRPLKVQVPLPEAEAAEAQAIGVYDAWCWLLGEIRQALEPVSSGHLVSVAQSRATLETAVELLRELGHREITAFADDLGEKIPQLLMPLEWLEQHLQPLLQGLEEKDQAFILWAWEYRQQLGLNIAADIPENLQAVVRAAWDILGLLHRSSSLAESLHSWLRPYLQIHRGMTRWLLPLLQLFWNHHAFERGKRVGHTPLELAGVENAPPLANVLGLLVCPGRVVQPA
ncbi:MAG: hypothetical protein NUW24_16085 [Anaerolineae bacterium]|jgi:nucleotide-binding universal stress UspA family protein|nr:hypothetical protein [Anaerolineae bacterium]